MVQLHNSQTNKSETWGVHFNGRMVAYATVVSNRIFNLIEIHTMQKKKNIYFLVPVIHRNCARALAVAFNMLFGISKLCTNVILLVRVSFINVDCATVSFWLSCIPGVTSKLEITYPENVNWVNHEYNNKWKIFSSNFDKFKLSNVTIKIE